MAADRHFIVSMVKSTCRIVSCVAFMWYAPNLGILIAAAGMLFSEIIGIIEELV